MATVYRSYNLIFIIARYSKEREELSFKNGTVSMNLDLSKICQK